METHQSPDLWRRPTSSLQSYEGIDPIRLESLTTAAKRLFSQFRVDATVDPKTYLAAAIAIFAHYTSEVVLAVTHPFTGMASKQNWLPTLHEIRKACDQAAAPPPRSGWDAVEETLARRKSDDVAGDALALRRAHVDRLGQAGKLSFAGDKSTSSWFDRMSVNDALEIQRKYTEGAA